MTWMYSSWRIRPIRVTGLLRPFPVVGEEVSDGEQVLEGPEEPLHVDLDHQHVGQQHEQALVGSIDKGHCPVGFGTSQGLGDRGNRVGVLSKDEVSCGEPHQVMGSQS